VKLSGDVNNHPDDLDSDFDTFRFLVGGLEDFFSLYIYIFGIIIPTDLYFSGVDTTNQIQMMMISGGYYNTAMA
jgi:hypothetical protein